MKTIRRVFGTCLFSVFVLNGMAQTNSGYTRQGIDSLLQALETTIRENHMPGLMISIVTKDSILYSGGIGFADIEKKVKVNGATLFHLASITKTFTALGIQKLVSEGKLKLNDPIAAIAPEIPFENKWEKAHPVRVIHLLEHTAGFDDVHLNNMVNTSGKPRQGIEAISFVKNSLRSRWKPGEKFSYASPGYEVLGYIIQKLSGRPWNEYIAGEVFRPLGMAHTGYDLDGKEKENYATGYYHDDGRFVPFPFYMPGGNGAASALVSGADDMAVFLRHLLNGWKMDSIHWLPESYLADMETIHSTLAAKHGLQTGYSPGFDLFPNNKKVTFRGHNGKGEGFGSWIFYNREAGIGYAISNNGGQILWPVSVLIERFLTQPFEKPVLPESQEDLSHLASFTGYYKFTNPRSEMWSFHEQIFKGVQLSFAGNQLVVRSGRGNTDTLLHAGGMLFRAKGDIIPAYVLGKDEDGRPFFQGRGNEFYSQSDRWPVVVQQVLIYGGILAMLVSLLLLPVLLLLAAFKKLSWKILPAALFPALAVGSIFLAYRKLSVTDAIDKAIFTSVNATTLTIFLGSAAFGLFTLCGALFLFRKWNRINSKWLKGIFAANILLLCYMTGLLLYHGWIGVRVWAL
ncbi:serine hydrolase domain-containing protein [Chitinophaga sp. GCM10012297]|uniref:Beta-lactamase family protein n=1 Tax=Chitinophaga chungangae TaxID=2821488 RepID=A0ABS3YG41_9BACT|nr:serine hydrolase domain-containing protein [Chitinophaga chungangae]MBO9153636.1 beta-lactamase family protein [Chitinophaga chungangae]